MFIIVILYTKCNKHLHQLALYKLCLYDYMTTKCSIPPDHFDVILNNYMYKNKYKANININ